MESNKRSAHWPTIFVVLGLGFLLVVFHLLTHMGDFFAGLFLRVDHPLTYSFPQYDRLLHEVVKGDRVDYAALKKDKLLDEAVADLAKTSPDHLESADEQLCFWINSYNLLALKAITDVYPIKSVRQTLNAFGTNKFLIGAKPLSLNIMYQNFLTPRLRKQPSAFFLVCGGSLGYPPLLDHAIRPDKLAADGEIAAKAFVNNPQNVYYVKAGKVFGVSPLLKWNENILHDPHLYVTQFLPTEMVGKVTEPMAVKTVSRDFNWWLNDTATVSKQAAGKPTH